jgi:hypothetical protein
MVPGANVVTDWANEGAPTASEAAAVKIKALIISSS